MFVTCAYMRDLLARWTGCRLHGLHCPVLAVAVFARVAGWAEFHAYPLLRAPAGARTLSVAAVLALVALAPFADRRGIER